MSFKNEKKSERMRGRAMISVVCAAALAMSLTGCRRGNMPGGETTSGTESENAATAGWEPQETIEIVDMSGRRAVAKPTVDSATLKYTGEELEFLPSGFDSELMEIEGAVGREVGEYTAIVSLKDTEGCAWSDSTVAPMVFAWAIREDGLAYQVTLTDRVLHITHPEGAVSYSADIVMPEGGGYSLDQENGALTLNYGGTSQEDPVWTLSGTYGGSVIFDAGEDNNIVIELAGFAVDSARACPIYIKTADNADISAKKDTVNDVHDTREAVEEYKAAIYSECDLKLKGAGTLNVVSDNNNGIHTKDDLVLQKLILRVSSVDNALKGNDSVTVNSGDLTLISRAGDGIKTSKSSLSLKGHQKGSVTVNDGTVNIYAACDGIDAAFDVMVNGGILNIYTDKYSSYSDSAIAESGGQIFDNIPGDIPGDMPGGIGDGIPKSDTPDNIPGGVSMGARPNDKGDNKSNGRPGGMGGFGGFGGMSDGNSDKSDHSAKGIKAANEIVIDGGEININAYDDAVHANSDDEIESGVQPLGNVTVSGGKLTLASNDDAIHADGAATVSGGEINIIRSYEGIEGDTVVISDGVISIISSDDGINGTATSGTAINIAGGMLYVYAGGDGVDSNSRASYSGIEFSGGRSVIISTGRADSSIDTEKGYKFSGGYVVGIGMSGGMGSESANCQNFSSVGKKSTVSIKADGILTVDGIVSVKMPESMNALVVLLGDTKASITSGVTTDDTTFDQNGVAWMK